MEKQYRLLEYELTLDGLIEIHEMGSEGGWVLYDDGITVDISEAADNLDDIEDFLKDNNFEYEIRCVHTDDIYNKNYHKDCKNDYDYDNSIHSAWCIKIIK